MYNIYKRQQPSQLIIPPELQEQYDLPIYKIIQSLKAGNTIKVALKIDGGFFVSAANGGEGLITATGTMIGATPDRANFISEKGLLMFALVNEPRFLTAYGVATGPRTRLIVIPQAEKLI